MVKSTSSETLLKEAKDAVQDAWNQDRENRDDAFLDLKMLAGDQWPESVRRQREADGRPCLTVNKLPQFVHQVANDIRANPPGIKVTPVGGKHDVELAKIYSGIIRDIEYRSDAPSIYAQAGGHAVACGIGHYRVATEYASDDTFDQEILIKRIPHPLSVLWDPGAVNPDRSDAMYCVVTELMHREAFKKRYPKATPSNFDIPTPAESPEGGMYWASGDMVRIAEYWRKRLVKRKIVQLQDGTIWDVTNFAKTQFAGLPIVRERSVDGYEIESVLLSGTDLLSDLTLWAGRYIPIVPVIGGEIPLETKLMRYGLVRFARDPQQIYNYARSAAIETIALAPKAPYLATTKMIGKYKTQWDSHNTTQRPYLLYDPDPNVPGGKPMREMPPDVPMAFVQEAGLSSDDIKSTIGIYDASLGARSNETSGRAIVARERQGDAATAHFSGNLNGSLVHTGRILIDLIPRIYDTHRVQRILDEDGSENFVEINQPVMSDRGEPILMNDLSQGRYDVRLRTGPSYATRRLEAADSMLQFVQAVPGAGALMGDLIAQSMDWPGADEIAERLKKAMPPNIVGPDKDDPQAMQAQMQAQQLAQQQQQMAEMAAKLEMLLKIAQTEKTRADARKSASAAQAEQLKTLIAALTSGVQPPPDGFAEDEAMAGQLLGGMQSQPQPQPQANPQFGAVQPNVGNPQAVQAPPGTQPEGVPQEIGATTQ